MAHNQKVNTQGKKKEGEGGLNDLGRYKGWTHQEGELLNACAKLKQNILPEYEKDFITHPNPKLRRLIRERTRDQGRKDHLKSEESQGSRFRMRKREGAIREVTVRMEPWGDRSSQN